MKKAVVFPGQGSQYPNMGLSLYRDYPESRAIFDLVDQVSGVKVTKTIFDGEKAELKNTLIQQLAILAVSLAAYQQAKDKLGVIDFLAGLSLGEYTCLYAAGSLQLKDLILLVKKRAEAMQRAAEQNSSAMLAVIGGEKRNLKEKAEELGFYIANFTAPSQIVISVASRNKNKVKETLEQDGFRVVELEVSGGFHSPFMDSAESGLRQVIDQLNFSDAAIPIVSNVGAVACTGASQIKNNLIAQLISPVLWVDSINYLAGKGVSCIYEIGPSKVLKGLIRKIDKSLKVINIEKSQDVEGICSQEKE